MITRAAIKTSGGRIYIGSEGERHGDIMRENFLAGHEENFHGAIQGFWTQDGRFVDREEAANIALEAGQISKIPAEVFTSENLW
jgi:hypothetical protein